MCCVPEGGGEHQYHFSVNRTPVSSVELCANPLQTQPRQETELWVAQLMHLLFSSVLTHQGPGAVGMSNRSSTVAAGLTDSILPFCVKFKFTDFISDIMLQPFPKFIFKSLIQLDS